MDTHSIEYKFNALPGDSRKEALDFIDSPMTKKPRDHLGSVRFYLRGRVTRFEGRIRFR
uniref:Uncharacterized protein n=1 Tax=Candidatus Kentrum sp. LFY TaxID=2126342 RepID=A0A450X4U1_9GAMM|nr:MAG: hypothetical protein BECKLFY1418C_GA0070996_11733 [Candidatus Kentron sp. LFY]